MKRLLLGSLAALVFSFAAASPAAAVEIPPTDECLTTFETGFENYYAEIDKGVSDREERQADRRFVRGLAASGCISDAEPLLKEVNAKPHSSECVAAASAAQDFWGPVTSRIKAELKSFRRTVRRPLMTRVGKIRSRVKVLKRRGASDRRVNRLERKSSRLLRKLYRQERRSARRIENLVGKDASATTLIFYEFLALRCIAMNAFDEDVRAEGPAVRVYRRNALLIWLSLFQAAQDAMGDSGDAFGSGVALPPSVSASAEPVQRG